MPRRIDENAMVEANQLEAVLLPQLSLRTTAALLLAFCHDLYAEPPPPQSAATTWDRDSRVAVLCERTEANLGLWHPDDLVLMLTSRQHFYAHHWQGLDGTGTD